MGRPSYDEGWYYKQNGERFGPVSRLQLRELVTSGQVQPRQAVWKQSTQNLFFVWAATVAFGTESEVLDCRSVG
jgi:hypothetical protein